jgi:hypothetical protein
MQTSACEYWNELRNSGSVRFGASLSRWWSYEVRSAQNLIADDNGCDQKNDKDVNRYEEEHLRDRPPSAAMPVKPKIPATKEMIPNTMAH